LDITKKYKLEEALKKIKLRKKASKTIQSEKIITPEEKDKLIEHANPSLQFMIQFLWDSGVRISEILGIGNLREAKRIAPASIMKKITDSKGASPSPEYFPCA
jgi:integrase